MHWFVILACLVVSFTFSGIEAGLISLNRLRLRHHVRQGDRAAILLDRLLLHPGRLLVTVLLVTNFMNILALVLATMHAVRFVGIWGYPLAGALGFPVLLVITEILPKSIFRRFPYRLLAFFAGVLWVVSIALWPLLESGSRIGRWVAPRRVVRPKSLFAAREHFKFLTAEGARSGSLRPMEKRMIDGVIDFRNVTVADLVKPPGQVVAVAEDTPAGEAIELSRRHGLSHLPVMGDGGQITGVVDVIDLLLDEDRSRRVAAHLRRIVVARPGDSAYLVMRKLRAARVPLAAVLDSAGVPQGIVALDRVIARLLRGATN